MTDIQVMVTALDQLAQAAVDHDTAESSHDPATRRSAALHRLKEAARTYGRLQRALNLPAAPIAETVHAERCGQCRKPVRVDGTLGYSPVTRKAFVLCFGCASHG